MNEGDIEGYQTASVQGTGQPLRIVPEKLSIYYSNCAMVATSPVDIALFFGRYVQTNPQGQGPALAELYERQIYMTIEQARRLAQVLTQTVAALDAGSGIAAAPQERPRPAPAAPADGTSTRPAGASPAPPAPARGPTGPQQTPVRKP